MFVAKEKNCYVLYIICFMKILMYRKTIRIHVAFQKDSVVCSYKRWKKIRRKIIAAKYEKCGNHFSTCLSSSSHHLMQSAIVCSRTPHTHTHTQQQQKHCIYVYRSTALVCCESIVRLKATDNWTPQRDAASNRELCRKWGEQEKSAATAITITTTEIICLPLALFLESVCAVQLCTICV